MKISIIVALEQTNAIGKDNKLLWRLKKDMQWFKNHTSGHCILMGRKTYESLGKPLPNRTNIVITKNSSASNEDVIFLNSIEEGINYAKSQGERELFIIGGGNIYEQTLDIADSLYITLVDCELEGDTYFPDINFNDYTSIFEEYHDADEQNQYPFSFLILNKKV